MGNGRRLLLDSQYFSNTITCAKMYQGGYATERPKRHAQPMGPVAGCSARPVEEDHNKGNHDEDRRSNTVETIGRLAQKHAAPMENSINGMAQKKALAEQTTSKTFHRLPHGHTLEAVTWFNILAVGIMFAYAAIRLHDATRWKVLLATGSAYALYWATPLMQFSTRGTVDFVQAYLWSQACLPAIFVVIALVAVFLDWPRRATRDWVHWLGVSLWTLGNLATLPTSLHMVWLWTKQ